MAINPDAAYSRGNIMREISELKRRLRGLETARTLEAASIGSGGLTVKGGFIAILNESGAEIMRLATDGLSLTGLLSVMGNIALSGGGDFTVNDGSIVVNDQDDNEVIRLATAGLTLNGLLSVLGDIQLSGSGEIRSQNFNGDTNADDPGTQGWALGNDKLALLGVFMPVTDSTSHDDLQTGFAIDTTPSDKASVVVSVPDWATEASVLTSSVFAVQNTAAGSRQIHNQPRIAGDDGFEVVRTVPAGEIDVWTISHSRTFDVSATSNFGISGRMWTTSGSISSGGSNGCTVSALVIFRSTQ